MGERIPKEREYRLDAIFDALDIVAEGTYVYLCDMQYDYSRWSKSAVDRFGLPGEYMSGAGDIWEEHIHPDDRESYHKSIENIFSGVDSGHDMQYRAKRKDGAYAVCTCRGLVIRSHDGEPEYFGGIIRIHGVQGQIDELTGLRNQYGFFEDLRNLLDSQTPVSLTLLGISHFSEINEMYGYHFGNRVLQVLGRYLFEYIGNTGCVYRMDGTRFITSSSVSVLRSQVEILERYREVRQHFRKGVKVDGRTVMLELNAGFLNLDSYDIDDQTILACLDFAYDESKVKKQGDLVVFCNDLTEENRRRVEQFQVIRRSINLDYQGFFLLYQPVVDARSEKLIGAEALLRWKNEEYGIVPPNDFIPPLEKDPLFPDLGMWILRKALQDAKRILQDHPDFVINVNLSYSQLEKPDFVESVMKVLKEEAFPPQHLCLEVTERCRLLDLDMLKNTIVKLRGEGIIIALDDFGTGFSALSLLKDITFDVLKIDRSFVMRIEENIKDRELVRYCTELAALFEAKVCVEGLETSDMRDILLNYRVHSFQGYYYAKPLEMETFLQWQPPQNDSPDEKKHPCPALDKPDDVTNDDARNEMLIEAIESQNVGTMITDAATAEILLVNQMAKDFFEVDPNKTALSVMDFRCKFSEEGDQHFISGLMELRSGKGEVEFEQALYRNDNSVVFIQVNAKKIQLSSGRAIIIYSFMNISDRKRLEEDLQIQSETDYLTGICNRRSGEFKIQRLLEEGGLGMLCLFDVDKFKSVNDNFGHATGDNLLIKIAKTMIKTFRSSDILVRLGGDEFVIFAEGIQDRKLAEILLKRFFSNLESMQVEGMEGNKISVSLGAVIVRENESFSTIYNKADSLMYECKARTGNAYAFYGESV